jgi:hypothetical protein
MQFLCQTSKFLNSFAQRHDTRRQNNRVSRDFNPAACRVPHKDAPARYLLKFSTVLYLNSSYPEREKNILMFLHLGSPSFIEFLNYNKKALKKKPKEGMSPLLFFKSVF